MTKNTGFIMVPCEHGGIDKPHFEIGEMVRLDGFGLPGNNGVFRVTGIPASGIIRLGNVARCSSNLNCFAPNRMPVPCLHGSKRTIFLRIHWLTTDVRQDAMVTGGAITIQMVLSSTTAVVTVRGLAMIVLCQRLLAR